MFVTSSEIHNQYWLHFFICIKEARLSNYWNFPPCMSSVITLLTKICLVKAMVFPVVMYGHESWTIKKAEHRRIGAFELWYWRRLLRSPWTTRRSNQWIIKELNPEYSLEGLMLKLKCQNFGHLKRIIALLEKTLMVGKIEGKRRGGASEDEMVK